MIRTSGIAEEAEPAAASDQQAVIFQLDVLLHQYALRRPQRLIAEARDSVSFLFSVPVPSSLWLKALLFHHAVEDNSKGAGPH